MKKSGIAFIVAAALALPVFGQQAKQNKDAAAAQGSTKSSAMSEGEVRRVDKEAKKITIRHGPLANLDMPAMSMVFQVKDRAMLDQVKAGDKVKFRAEKINGAFTLVEIQSAQ